MLFEVGIKFFHLDAVLCVFAKANFLLNVHPLGSKEEFSSSISILRKINAKKALLCYILFRSINIESVGTYVDIAPDESLFSTGRKPRLEGN